MSHEDNVTRDTHTSCYWYSIDHAATAIKCRRQVHNTRPLSPSFHFILLLSFMRYSKGSILNVGHLIAFLTGMLTTLAMVGFVLHGPMVNQAMHQWSKRADAAAPSGEDILQFGNPGKRNTMSCNGMSDSNVLSIGPVVDLLKRKEYVASYDRRLRLPHWVGEHLTAESLTAHPDVDRSNSSFHEDDDLPKLFRAHLKDYSRSGYDRGHMAPAGDAVQTQEAMDETFLLSNMAPQVGIGFNRHCKQGRDCFLCKS